MINMDVLRIEERVTIGIDVGESHFREFKSACHRDAHGVTTARDVRSCVKISRKHWSHSLMPTAANC